MIWKLVAKAVFVIGTTTLAYFNMPVALFGVAVIMLAALYDKADSLIELSFGPLTAKLERNISESEKLLSGLRSLSLALSKTVVAASASTGRFASDDAWIFHAMKDVENGLLAIGASQSELIEARSALVKLTIRDLGATATNGSQLPIFLGETAMAEWKDFRRTEKLSDPEFIESWLNANSVLGPEQVEVLSAMRWIRDNQDIRDEPQYMLTKREVPLALQHQ